MKKRRIESNKILTFHIFLFTELDEVTNRKFWWQADHFVLASDVMAQGERNRQVQGGTAVPEKESTEWNVQKTSDLLIVTRSLTY